MSKESNLAFIASTCSSVEMEVLRADLYQWGVERDESIWVAECTDKRLNPKHGLNALEIADRCLEEIDRSEQFIMFLDGGVGSYISLRDREAASTFIELELFQAVMREKPIHPIVIGQLSEEGPARRLLNLVTFGVKCDVIEVQSHGAGFDAATRILAAAKARHPFDLRRRKQYLSGHLAIDRHQDFANQKLFNEIEFLRGQPFVVADGQPDLDLVKTFLDDARNQSQTERKMSRTWLALRSLMQMHYSVSSEPRALALWEEGLRIWANLSAWRGHHAHLWLGHIAALGSLKSVIEAQGRQLSQVAGDEHGDNIGGALASAYYSLSKIAPQSQSSSLLDRGTLYLRNSIATVEEDHLSHLYAALGSHDLLRGNRREAVRHYRYAIELAERFHHHDQRMGELLAELGWAEVLRGSVFTGRARIKEGVDLMIASSAGEGFVARGLSKLAAAEVVTMCLVSAFDTTRRASAIIAKHGLHDQRNVLIKISDKLQTALDKLPGRERRP